MAPVTPPAASVSEALNQGPNPFENMTSDPVANPLPPFADAVFEAERIKAEKVAAALKSDPDSLSSPLSDPTVLAPKGPVAPILKKDSS